MWKLVYVCLLMVFATNGGVAKKRVCIVGAGVSGLVSLKYFSEFPDEFEPVVFEKNSDVGGLWIYINSTTVDEHGLPVHSSIYKNLRSMVPKEMMTFQDFPNFDGEAAKGTCAKHHDVLQYLRNYTDHFNLREHIQFNTNVEQVSPLPNLRWLIATRNLDSRRRNEIICDVAIICNGHESKGNIPKISNIESFTGRVLHSHVYREPEAFANETVVVLGASISGIDIGNDLCSTAKKVYLSHRHTKLPDVFPPNLEQVAGVVAADGSELILSNGSRVSADTLLLCTGYVYDFPFLDRSTGIVVEVGKYVRSLYKHLINIEHPTMAIINVFSPGLHFQIPRAQVSYFGAVLRGKIRLPSREQMFIESQLPENVPKNKAHNLSFDDIFKYFNELSLASGGKPLPWWFAAVASEEVQKIAAADPLHFKDKKLVIYEDERRVEYV